MLDFVLKSRATLDTLSGLRLPFHKSGRSLGSSRHFQLQMPLYPGLLLPSMAGNIKCSGGNAELSFLVMVSKHFRDEFAVSSSFTTEPQSFSAKNGQ